MFPSDPNSICRYHGLKIDRAIDNKLRRVEEQIGRKQSYEDPANGTNNQLLPKNIFHQRTHALSKFHCKAHQGPPRALHKGEEHVVAHEDLLTWDEQGSVDIGAKPGGTARYLSLHRYVPMPE